MGFSGTQICGDPERNIYTIFLTNRVYPNKNDTKISKVRNTVNSAIQQVYDTYYKTNDTTLYIGISVATSIMITGIVAGCVLAAGVFCYCKKRSRNNYVNIN